MTGVTSTHTVLVTGGYGFIGSVIADALQRSGSKVRRGSRNISDPQAVVCNLDKPAEIRAAALGADAVVHTAYGDNNAMMQQCKNLLAAMDQTEVYTLIYFSSIAVYGERTGQISETMQPAGALDDYASAKCACEALVQQWAAASAGRRAVIVRPGIVYGAGSPFWIKKLSERIRLGVWGTFGESGDGYAALVHINDVAGLTERALSLCLTGSREQLAASTIVNIMGPELVTWNGYFTALAQALRAPPLRALSPSEIAARQKLALVAKIWRRLGLPGGTAAALAATPGEIALFSRKAHYLNTAAAEIFGYSPATSLKDGLAKSLR